MGDITATSEQTGQQRQQAAVGKVLDHGKQAVVKYANGVVSSATGGLADAEDAVSSFGDIFGVNPKTGKGYLTEIWEWIKSLFQPILDFFKGIFGLLDPNAKITEEKLPEKIKAAGNYKTAATTLGLKEEVGTGIQKIIADSAAAYAKDGIPEFDEDGTPTTTINHVITTHNSIVEYLAGKPDGSSAGRLALTKPYDALPQEQLNQAAQWIASYFTGFRPEANLVLKDLLRTDDKGNYINISGGLAQTLLAIQAKANTKDANGKATVITEADFKLAFDSRFLTRARDALKPGAAAVDPNADPGLAAAAAEFERQKAAAAQGQGNPSAAPSGALNTPAAPKAFFGLGGR